MIDQPPSPEEYAEVAKAFERLCELPAEERRRALESYVDSNPSRGRWLRTLIDHDLEPEESSGPTAAGRGVVDIRVGARVSTGYPSVTVGDRVGGHVIRGLIGRGASGAVYLAEQPSPRRLVALKILPDRERRPELLRRFEIETDLLGRLRHPGVAGCHAAGLEPVVEGVVRPWISMDFVEGMPADRWVAERRVSVRQRVKLVRTVCLAIHHAHQQRVVHRDLKPGNILVDDAGVPTVVDFGVALALDATPSVRLSEQSLIIGSIGFMSPEQARGGAMFVDARADVHGLGAVLHALLFGHPPHNLAGASIAEAVGRVATQPAAPAEVSRRSGIDRDLAAIIDRAVAFHPDDRYASAATMAEDLDRWLRGEAIAARPTTLSTRVGELVRHHWRVVAPVAILSVLVLVAWTSVVVTQSMARLDEATTATEQASRLLDFVTGAEPGRAPDRDLADSGYALATSGQVDLLPDDVRALLQYRFGAFLHQIGDHVRAIDLIERALPGLDQNRVDAPGRLAAIEARIDLSSALRSVALDDRSSLDEAADHLAEARNLAVPLVEERPDIACFVSLESALLAHRIAQRLGPSTPDGFDQLAKAEGWLLDASSIVDTELAAAESAHRLAQSDESRIHRNDWQSRRLRVVQGLALIERQLATNVKRSDPTAWRAGLVRVAERYDEAAVIFQQLEGVESPGRLSAQSASVSTAYSILQAERRQIPSAELLSRSTDLRAELEPTMNLQLSLLGKRHAETLASRNIFARLIEYEAIARRAMESADATDDRMSDGPGESPDSAEVAALVHQAIELRRELLADYVAAHGAQDERVVRVHLQLGDTLRTLVGGPGEMDAYEAAWNRAESALGVHHLLTLTAVYRTARARSRAGDPQGALAAAADVMARHRRNEADGAAGLTAVQRPRMEALLATDGRRDELEAFDESTTSR